MKQLIKWSVPAIALALTVGSASAVQIVGSITFSGGVQLDTPLAETATEVTAWNNPIVSSAAGAFAGASGAVTLVQPWTFNSGPVSSFWKVDNFTFDLISSSITFQGAGFVAVSGTGTISGNGYTPTIGTWTFSASDPGAGQPAVFSFQSATGAVPDGGTTIMLLGATLTGLGLLKRKLSA